MENCQVLTDRSSNRQRKESQDNTHELQKDGSPRDVEPYEQKEPVEQWNDEYEQGRCTYLAKH